MIAEQPRARRSLCRLGFALALALGVGKAAGQNLYYVEADNPACAAVPAPTAAAPKTVAQGEAVRGRLHVACGFTQGSYTVTLNSTDAGAAFMPKTFLVNFGSVVGKDAFTVTFTTAGVHGISAAITSNMGSPAVRGAFVSTVNELKVVPR